MTSLNQYLSCIPLQVIKTQKSSILWSTLTLPFYPLHLQTCSRPSLHSRKEKILATQKASGHLDQRKLRLPLSFFHLASWNSFVSSLMRLVKTGNQFLKISLFSHLKNSLKSMCLNSLILSPVQYFSSYKITFTCILSHWIPSIALWGRQVRHYNPLFRNEAINLGQPVPCPNSHCNW